MDAVSIFSYARSGTSAFYYSFTLRNVKLEEDHGMATPKQTEGKKIN